MGVIRLLLAISVVLAHSSSLFGCTLVGGQLAVQSFYIISGFYMSFILNEKYIGANNSYRLFITNRLIRLFPVYWAILFATLLFCVAVAFMSKGFTITTFNSYQTIPPDFFSLSLLIFSNLFIFGQDIIMFFGIIPETGSLYYTSDFSTAAQPLYKFLFIPQAWTLGIELTFYLIAPFILRRRLSFILLLVVLSLFFRLWLYNYYGLKHDPWTYRFFPLEILFFLLGYLSYRILVYLKTKPMPPWMSMVFMSACIAFTIFYANVPNMKMSWLPFSYKELAFFSIITFSIPILFQALKKNKLDTAIGELSYPVYISHMLVIAIAGIVSTKFSSYYFLSQSWFIVLSTMLLAYLLNFFIAAPMEKIRQSRLKG